MTCCLLRAGEKAELRRFRDGALRQACVWAADDTQRHHIVAHIARHILARTFAAAVCVAARRRVLTASALAHVQVTCGWTLRR